MSSNKTSFTWLLRVFIGILLAFAITASYYWAHKPVEPVTAVVLAQTILGILVWLLVVWLASAIGSIFVKKSLFENSSITRLAIATGLGLGLISLLVFALGMLGLLIPWVAWLSVISLGILFRKQLRAVVSELRTIKIPKPEDTLKKWIWVFGTLMFFIAFTNALAPPTAWDSLVYHLTGPKLYIEAGHIGHPINNHYLGFPPLATMHFLYAILLAGERAAALFHFTYGVLVLILIVETARRYFDKEVAWHAALILISIPTFFSLIGIPYNDGTLLFYATASLYVFFRWRDDQRDDWLVILGLLLGFCVGVKYTAVAIPIIIALMILWASRNSGFAIIFRRLSIVTLLALVIAIPYFLENLATTGNPFYPFFIDNGIYWDAWRRAFYDRAGTGFAATAPLRLLIAPIEATVLGTEGTVVYAATIGPLLFTSIFLLPLAWGYIKKQERHILGYLLVFIGINYVLWLFGLARSYLLLQSRLLMPTFGAMAVTGGVALARIKQLTRPQLDFRWLFNWVLYINIGLLMVTAGFGYLQDNPIPVTLGLESEQAFFERRLGLYTIVIDHLNQLPEDARVLFLWEPRSYRCDIDCRSDALLDNFLHQTHFYQHDAGEMAADWRAQGITHVLINFAGLELLLNEGVDPITDEDLAILEALQTEELEMLEDFNGAYKLFVLSGE